MKRQNIRLILAFLMVCSCTALWFQLGSSSLENKTAPLRIGMCLNHPPFESQAASGQPSGASVALANALGDYLGKPVEIITLPRKSLESSLRSQRIDLILSSSSISSRHAGLCYSKPYAKTPLAMLAYKDSPVRAFISLNTPEVIIAVTTGSQASRWAAEQIPKAQIKLLPSDQKAIIEVAQGNADVFISDPLTIINAQEEYNDTTTALLHPLPHTKGWGMVVNKKNEALLKQINDFIEKKQKDGTFDQIRSTYLNDQMDEYKKHQLEYFF